MPETRYITYIGIHPATGLPMLMTKDLVTHLDQDEIQRLMSQAVALDLKQVKVMTWTEINAIREQQLAEIHAANTLTEIDYMTFDQMHHATYPHNWNNAHHLESFTLPQQVRSNVFMHFLRVGVGEAARYFQIEASMNTSNIDLYHMYVNAYGEPKVA